MFADFKSDGFMFAVAIIVIGFVLAQSVFFMVRAMKRAKELGIKKDTIKNTITSSAIFSIAPAVGIAVTVIALTVALGTVLPWIRLSVIGAITYEIPAAEGAIEAAGMTGGIGSEVTDHNVFSAVVWVMTIGSCFALIIVPLFVKKIQSKITGVAAKNGHWADVMSAAAFIGLIAAFLGRGFAGVGDKENNVLADGAGTLSLIAIISSVVIMIVISKIAKKTGWKWLDAVGMPLSMVLALVIVFVVANFAPDFAAIEWRY